MPFQPGNKLGKGRKKGSITKDRQMLLDKAKELGVDPFEILLRFAANDWKGLRYDSPTITKYTPKGQPYEEDRITVDNRIQAASQAAQYVLPKLKAIDVDIGANQGPIMLTLNLGGKEEKSVESQPVPLIQPKEDG